MPPDLDLSQLSHAEKDALIKALFERLAAAERRIAELLKFQKKLEEKQDKVDGQRQQLKDLMKKMRGKIPKEMQRGSDDEEDDDDDEERQDEDNGKKEASKQQQQRIRIGREQHHLGKGIGRPAIVGGAGDGGRLGRRADEGAPL